MQRVGRMIGAWRRVYDHQRMGHEPASSYGNRFKKENRLKLCHFCFPKNVLLFT